MNKAFNFTAPLWLKQIGWLVLIWLASVAALAIVASLLRFFMSAVGMTA
ncbi:DUF2474 domain-containing protein [Rheinheimera sp. A13L]|nr:DUF2474 domain-containing protein [Rheinheimera sp. A13L]